MRGGAAYPHAVRLLIRGVLVIATLGGVVYLGAYYLASSCTIGFAGNAASVSVNGADAAGWCSQQVRSTSSAYAADERKTDILVCRYPIGGRTYTVRDQGALLLVGNDLCKYFKTLYDGGRSGGAPTPILVPAK